MRVTFKLVTPSQKESYILIDVTWLNNRIRQSTGIKIPALQWNKRDMLPRSPQLRARLRGMADYIVSNGSDLSTREEIKEIVRVALLPDAERPETAKNAQIRPTFSQYFKEWSDRPKKSKRHRQLAYRTIMKIMGNHYDWNEVNTAYYAYLLRGLANKGYSLNYQGAIIAKLRNVMNEGFLLKYHTNYDYKKFKKPSEQADTIYLTKEEVNALWKIKLTAPLEQKARDLFLLGVFTASRYSDYSTLSTDNIKGSTLEFIQKKTGGKVILPLSPKVEEILLRNEGKAPKLCQQLLNKNIKEVCRKAGITQPATTTITKGDKRETTTTPKYELVSSHTARRTGATLLYKSGVSIRQCMLITGHNSEANFMKYIRITKEENAQLLADNPFFQ